MLHMCKAFPYDLRMPMKHVLYLRKIEKQKYEMLDLFKLSIHESIKVYEPENCQLPLTANKILEKNSCLVLSFLLLASYIIKKDTC